MVKVTASILLALALAGCGSGTPTDSPVAVESTYTDTFNFTLPPSSAPIYGVDAWVTGRSSDIFAFPGGSLHEVNFYPDQGAWHLAVITVQAPLNGHPLFSVTPGGHNVFALTAIAWDGSPVGF